MTMFRTMDNDRIGTRGRGEGERSSFSEESGTSGRFAREDILAWRWLQGKEELCSPVL